MSSEDGQVESMIPLECTCSLEPVNARQVSQAPQQQPTNQEKGGASSITITIQLRSSSLNKYLLPHHLHDVRGKN